MKRALQHRTCALVLLLALPWTKSIAAEPRWIALETGSFSAVSQVSERKSRDILRQLQVFQAVLASMTNLGNVAPRVPTQIFLLDEKAFARATEDREDVAGFFAGQPFRNDIVIDASRPTDLSLYAIYHEYVHFQARNQGHVALPAFYEEGLAQFVQYFAIRDGRYQFGFFPEQMWQRARSESMPLAQVLDVAVDSEEYRSHQFRRPFYFRSLLFVHYCQVGNRGCREPLLRFVARRVNGQATEEAFRAEFGKSTREFDEELDGYLPRAVGRTAWLPANSVPKPPAPVLRDISQEDADVQFAWLLLRVTESNEGIDALLAPKLAASPADGPTLAALARWHERENRRADADGLIERLEASPTAGAGDLVRAGFLLLDRARGHGAGSTEDARKAALQHSRRLFERSLELAPQHFEAAFGYGLTQTMQPDDLQKSLGIVGSAMQRFPESGELQLLVATQLDMLGKKEAARALMRRAACRAVDPELRALAREELGEVTCTKAQ